MDAAPSFDALPLCSAEGVPGREDTATLSREAVVWMETASLSRSFTADAAVGRESLTTDAVRFTAAPSLDAHLGPDFKKAESGCREETETRQGYPTLSLPGFDWGRRTSHDCRGGGMSI